MKKLFTLFILSCLIFLGTAGIHPVSAADFRSGDEVNIPSTATNLKDLYLFGGKIFVDAPVTNDIVAAGGDITISKPVTGSVIIAGGNLKVSGQVGGSIRAAGGKIRIDGPVRRDLVVAGGDVIVTRNAVVTGDAVLNGGKLIMEGPVRGKVLVNGGEVTLNASVSGNVSGEVGKLTLGPNAVINGDLSYTSQQRAEIAGGAEVQGRTNYNERKDPAREAEQFFAAGTVYKLLTDIILSVLFIVLFTRALTALLRRMTDKPVESGAIGLAFLIFFPILAIMLLILLWLGVIAWLTYAFVVLLGVILTKIFVGWFVLRWWENRDRKTYTLDWKAGVIGPVVLYVIILIPVLGWIAGALLMFVATGAVVQEAVRLISGQRLLPHKAPARKNK